MQFQLAVLLAAVHGSAAFAPIASMKDVFCALSAAPRPDDNWYFQPSGGIKQPDFPAKEVGDEQWQYQAWSSIDQSDFLPNAIPEDEWQYKAWSGIGQSNFGGVYQEPSNPPAPFNEPKSEPAPEATVPKQTMPEVASTSAKIVM
eukprot:scaffold674_cov126-Cylindrotheca_fusiformis.AAC.4